MLVQKHLAKANIASHGRDLEKISAAANVVLMGMAARQIIQHRFNVGTWINQGIYLSVSCAAPGMSVITTRSFRVDYLTPDAADVLDVMGS